MISPAPRKNEAEPLVDVMIEDPRWDAFGLDQVAQNAVRATLAGLGLPETGFTLCVMGCDDARIAVLNGTFRGKGTPTNVLSWPAEVSAPGTGCVPGLPAPGTADAPAALGDIALAYDTCMAEAAAQGKSAQDHVMHLIVHGMLHLLGYDHVDDRDAALMEAIEVRVLAPLGISNPY